VIENQEDGPETAEFVKSSAHWPELTPDEQLLLDEVAAVAPPTWSSRTLRKVLGSRTIRDIAARDPELVRRAFLIGARHRGTVPMRMWHVEGCPHWEAAARELAAEQAPPDAPAELPVAADPTVQVVAAEPVEVPAEPPVDAAAARAEIAAKLAGKGYVPLTGRTRDIARQRAVPAEAVGARE
jgi:hypothetical protein